MSTITITLTGRPPVTINEDTWPEIAHVHDWDGKYSVNAFRDRHLYVRQHADGRAIVYGHKTSAVEGEKNRYAGVMVDNPDAIPDAIHQVADLLGFDFWVAEDCIAQLPAVELD